METEMKTFAAALRNARKQLSLIEAGDTIVHGRVGLRSEGEHDKGE